jgi:hypothetical protein
VLRHILFLPSGTSDRVWALAVLTDSSTKYADDCKVYSPWECPFNLAGYAPSFAGHRMSPHLSASGDLSARSMAAIFFSISLFEGSSLDCWAYSTDVKRIAVTGAAACCAAAGHCWTLKIAR